jgi:hypothetical protein
MPVRFHDLKPLLQVTTEAGADRGDYSRAKDAF